MSVSDKYIAIKTDGKIEVHAHSTLFNYVTLCGMDGNDPLLNMETVDLPKGAKIDCDHCLAVFKEARKFSKADFKS